MCGACTVVVLPIAVDVVRNVRSKTHAAVEIVVVVVVSSFPTHFDFVGS